jgi:hypothetical protein
MAKTAATGLYYAVAPSTGDFHGAPVLLSPLGVTRLPLSDGGRS